MMWQTIKFYLDAEAQSLREALICTALTKTAEVRVYCDPDYNVDFLSTEARVHSNSMCWRTSPMLPAQTCTHCRVTEEKEREKETEREINVTENSMKGKTQEVLPPCQV